MKKLLGHYKLDNLSLKKKKSARAPSPEESEIFESDRSRRSAPAEKQQFQAPPVPDFAASMNAPQDFLTSLLAQPAQRGYSFNNADLLPPSPFLPGQPAQQLADRQLQERQADQEGYLQPYQHRSDRASLSRLASGPMQLDQADSRAHLRKRSEQRRPDRRRSDWSSQQGRPYHDLDAPRPERRSRRKGFKKDMVETFCGRARELDRCCDRDEIEEVLDKIFDEVIKRRDYWDDGPDKYE